MIKIKMANNSLHFSKPKRESIVWKVVFVQIAYDYNYLDQLSFSPILKK